MQKLAERLGIRIVHGHEGVMDISRTHVIALNSRTYTESKEGKQFSIVAARVGQTINPS